MNWIAPILLITSPKQERNAEEPDEEKEATGPGQESKECARFHVDMSSDAEMASCIV